MKVFCPALFLFLITIRAIAQNPDGQLSDVTFGKTAITQFSEPIAASKKVFYLNESWLDGEFQLLNGEKFGRYPMKFDLIERQLYFKHKNVVRVISANLLQGFAWVNSNSEREDFLIESIDDIGSEVFRIEFEDSVSLFSRYSSKIVKANYNEALSVGNKNDQIKLVKEFYYRIGNGKFVSIPSNKKKVIKSIRGEYKNEIMGFISSNKLKFKNDKDFFSLIKYWNSLFY